MRYKEKEKWVIIIELLKIAVKILKNFSHTFFIKFLSTYFYSSVSWAREDDKNLLKLFEKRGVV
jgi:hypothetical protein